MGRIKKSKKLFILACTLLFLAAGLLTYNFVIKDWGIEKLDYAGTPDSFIERALRGELREVRVSGQVVRGVFEENGELKRFKATVPLATALYIGNSYYTLDDWLRVIYKDYYPDKEIKIKPGEYRSKLSLETYMFYGFVGLMTIAGLFFVFYIFVGRQWIEGKKFLSTAARIFTREKISFSDVAGIDEAIEELREVVDFAGEPEGYYKTAGVKIPKGVILHGPPGCGKTLIAKAIANEAGVSVYGIIGSEFIEMYVGVGAARVRALFEQAKKNAPCIIFVDEIDALIMPRGSSDTSAATGERNQTVNQFLAETDGIESGQGIIIIGATNRLDIIDPAAIRAGRFDRKIYVGLPDIKGREEILRVHTKNKPLAKDVSLRKLAGEIKLGSSGADIENICNEAAILAVRKRKEEEKKHGGIINTPLTITRAHFTEAIYKVLFGPERKTRIMTDERKKETAYHEAGHAVIAHYSEHLDPVSIVTIVPRGEYLGFVDTAAEKEFHTEKKERLTERVLFCLGGLAAEEIFLGTQTTGVGQDLINVTILKLKMKYQYGMSEMGPVALPFKIEDLIKQGHFSLNEMLLQAIKEAGKEAKEDLEKAKKTLEAHKPMVEKVVNHLMAKETLSGEEFRKILSEVAS